MNESIVTLAGNVVADPQIIRTKEGVPFATFRMASTPRRVDFTTGEVRDLHTSFVNVIAWRGLGQNVHESVRKGQPVVVYGKWRVREWRNEERSGVDVEIEALNVGHDLRWGRSAFERVTRVAPARPPQPPTAGQAPAESAATDPDGEQETADAEALDAAGVGREAKADFEQLVRRADTDDYVLTGASAG
ncbi:MAG TPA: single-stranded DNA-binding protein [Dermatophilaceae bacterium]|nr:single-stranded DNA-binding protein [Dermatophilaceae bacterium]